MNAIVYLLAAVLGFFGVMFIVGAQGQVMRIVVGVILFAAAGVLVYMTRIRPQQTTVVQKIELSGDVSLEEMKCRNCGGALSDRSLTVKAGAVFVDCEHCGTKYQLEEAPKW